MTGKGRGSDPGRLHVALALVDLHLPGVQSLKGKRALVKRAQAALVADLGASVSEVGFQDAWQRAALGVAVAASSASGAERVLDRVRAVVERDPRVVVTSVALEASTFDRDDHDPELGALAGIVADPSALPGAWSRGELADLEAEDDDVSVAVRRHEDGVARRWADRDTDED